jgi:hypothetical protein
MGQMPQLIQRIKALQPEASNRAIAQAIGVDESTVRADARPAGNPAPEPGRTTPVADESEPRAGNPARAPDEPDEAAGAYVEGEEELPDFLFTEGWTSPEHAHAYALYVGLPADDITNSKLTRSHAS